MSEAIPQSPEAIVSRPVTGSVARTLPRQNIIQCRQCSEHFHKSTITCPRCNRWNDRSPRALAIKILIITVFIATVSWTIWAIVKSEAVPRPEPRVLSVPDVPAGTNQADIRF